MIKAPDHLQDLRRKLYVKNHDMKRTGERSAGNPHAAFDAAGAGNVAWLRCCDTRITERASNREHKLQPTLTRQSSTLPRTSYTATDLWLRLAGT
jgi:hypothetical protein